VEFKEELLTCDPGVNQAAPFFMLYLISIPSPGFSLISLESILYRFGCAINVPFIVGALPSGAGSKTGAIVGCASPVFMGAGGVELTATFVISALARSVRCNALPV